MNHMDWNEKRLLIACASAMVDDPLCLAITNNIEQRKALAAIFAAMALNTFHVDNLYEILLKNKFTTFTRTNGF